MAVLERRNRCVLCGAIGEPLYVRLRDLLYCASGQWDMVACTNKECGLLWLDPTPTMIDLRSAYSRYHTHLKDAPVIGGPMREAFRSIRNVYIRNKYGNSVAGAKATDQLVSGLFYLLPTRRSRANCSVFHLPVVRDGRLLEIGCGSGRDLQVLKSIGWEAEGIDPDPGAVEVAKSKGLNARVGTVESQEYDESTFDAIVMNHVIEHVPNPVAFLQICNRILKPGGKIVMVTPNTVSWGHAHYRRNWRGLETPRHLYLYNYRCMRSLLRQAQLSDTDERIWSTAKEAADFFSMSEKIELASQRNDASASALSIARAGKAELLAWWERLLCLFNSRLGEELVVITSKPVP